MIHPTAIVHPNARIERGAEIGPFCLVGENVKIGTASVLQAHVVVNGWTTIGEACQIHPFATIGSPSQDRKYRGERAYTTVGDRTIVREYVSIQRGTGEESVTSVGDDCLLLAYVHIAHNCRIGNGVTMSNLAQLAGHCEVGEGAGIGGMVGMHQFVRVGKYGFVGGYSKIVRDVPPFFLVEGNPAKTYGLNSAGLRRAQFTPEQVAELKACYKLIYRSERNLSQAVQEIADVVKTEPGRELLAFLTAESVRGILK
ncbi:MAG: acyl-ACP--UDP-N-acetylglucosamine O-acyltransferase [Candidatus Eremiobacteraeota bacterium]|nr:acyl-ACP--UDP-N-acetylglucosamine O-acyltransferase [Candidatus Eremiobacteraeota bacterium]